MFLRADAYGQPGFRKALVVDGGIAVSQQFADLRTILCDEGWNCIEIFHFHSGDIQSRMVGMRYLEFSSANSVDPLRGGFTLPDMDHSRGFLILVNEAKENISEIGVAEARARLAANPKAVLMDVREDHEWGAGHAAEAVHLGRGILERDLEKKFPDTETEILMYCGGGFRSAMTADAARRMGYSNVHSILGGYKAMVAAGWPMTKQPCRTA